MDYKVFDIDDSLIDYNNILTLKATIDTNLDLLKDLDFTFTKEDLETYKDNVQIL